MGGYITKSGYSIVVLIAAIAVVLVVSGCTGGGAVNEGGATPTKAPTTPGGATAQPTVKPTAQPTGSAGVNEPVSVPDLYDFSKFSYVDTKLSMGGNVQDVRTEISDTDFNGVPAYRFKMTAASIVGEIVEDVYFDHDGKFIGGYLDGEDLPVAEWADHYKDHGWVKCGHNFKLTKTGTESITANGKTYQCTVYTTDRNGVTFTFWWSPSAPAPVKVAAQTMTETLVGWG